MHRLEGLSDRKAMDRFGFDLRWKYAAGGLDFDHPSFVHTVLVGRNRVLDSTPLYDAVATQDTVTLIRSAVRGLLRVAEVKSHGTSPKGTRAVRVPSSAPPPTSSSTSSH